ncbi:regulatory protein, luxR family [Streptomyces sp. di188]|nr:regulatory protein, luxR family [Streptomyces sp. di50b]SCE29438.1 regulatory protein, luxR family [Streptomyces sp. di188]
MVDLSLRRRLERLFRDEDWTVTDLGSRPRQPDCDVLVTDSTNLADERHSVPTVLVVRGDVFEGRDVPPDVRAIVDRDDLDSALKAAVREASDGHGWISPTLVLSVLQKVAHRSSGEGDGLVRLPGAEELTPREAEVVELVRQGLSNGEIAAALHVEESTVKFHMSNILRKTGSRDRARLLARLSLGAVGSPRESLERMSSFSV